MTKTIDTLVDDIYALFTTDNLQFNQSNLDNFGQRLANHIGTRISEQRATPTLRLSNIGTECHRKLWYTINTSSEGESLTPSTRFKFLFGDILEELLLFLAQEAGHEVRGQQDTVSIAGIKGHRDAIIDGRVVDVKSASSRSFEKFQSNGLVGSDPFGYLDQLSAYVSASSDATERDVGSFLVVDKTLGKICLDTYAVQDKNYEVLIEELKVMVAQSEPPERH